MPLGPTFGTLTYANGASKLDQLIFNGNFTITSTFTATGNSTVNRPLILSSVLGTQRTITHNGSTCTPTNVDFQDIKAAGTFGTWAGTSLGDCLGNSGITFDTSSTQTINATGSINWSSLATWTGSPARVPLPQDDVVINYSGGSATTLTADMPRLGRNIDFTGYTKTLQNVSPFILSNFGNLTFASGMTINSAATFNLYGRGAQTIQCNGKVTNQGFNIAAYGGTYTLNDTLSTNQGVSISNGTITTNNNTLSTDSFSVVNSFAVTINFGTSVISISNNSGHRFVSSVAATVNASLSTINFTGAVSGSVFFDGNGKTYGTLNWSSTASTGTLIITGANTFAALQSDNTTARTIQFPHGVTQTIAPGGWQIKGKSGAVISITSDSPGNAATLSCSSGIIVCDYLSIKDSAAIGGAAWYAGANSTSVSGNSGWIFSAAPSGAFTVSGASVYDQFPVTGVCYNYAAITDRTN